MNDERSADVHDIAPVLSPAEWGRRQAADSPPWSEEKWQRVSTLLGLRFTSAPRYDEREAA